MRFNIFVFLLLTTKLYGTIDSSVYKLCAKLEKSTTHRQDIETINSILNSRSNSKEEILKLNTILAIKFINIQQYDTCLKILDKQIDLAKKTTDLYTQAYYYKLKGNVYYYIPNRELATQYYKKCLEISVPKSYHDLSENCYHNLGSIRLDIGNYTVETESYFLKSIEYNKLNKLRTNKSYFHHLRMLATLYERQNKLEKAEDLYKKIIGELNSENNKYDEATAKIFYSEVLTKQKRYKEAVAMSFSTLRVVDSFNNIDILTTAYIIHAANLKAANQLDSAYHYLIKIQSLIRVQFNNELNTQITEAEAKFKNSEVLHEKNVAVLNAKRKLQMLLIVSLAIIGISILGFIHYKNKKQAKQEKELIQAVIQAEENERSRIAADLHDGIGQLLSAAKLNLHALENTKTDNKQIILEKAILLVDESAKEVRSVSHNIMPNALIKSGIVSAIKKFIDQLHSDRLKIKIETSGLTKSINTNIEIVVYRIIQECINNVIKHSGADQLFITLAIENDFLNIMIEDNGKGFDIEKAKLRDGIGLNNINTRVKFLKGAMEIDSRIHQGTVIAIHIPLNNKNDG